jgi:hypothetical protein
VLLQEALSAGHSAAAGLLGAGLGLGVVLLTTWASPGGAVDPAPAHPSGGRRFPRCSPGRPASSRSANGPSTRRLWYASRSSS